MAEIYVINVKRKFYGNFGSKDQANWEKKKILKLFKVKAKDIKISKKITDHPFMAGPSHRYYGGGAYEPELYSLFGHNNPKLVREKEWEKLGYNQW